MIFTHPHSYSYNFCKKNSSNLWMKIDWFIFALQGVESIQWHKSIIIHLWLFLYSTQRFLFVKWSFSRLLFIWIYDFSQTLQIYWMKWNPREKKLFSNALQIVIYSVKGNMIDFWHSTKNKLHFSQWNSWWLTIDEWIFTALSKRHSF